MRMFRLFSMAAAVLLLVFMCPDANPAGGQQPAGGPPIKSEFKGKILTVNVKSVAGNNVVVLENVRIQRLADVPFLVGRVLDQPEIKGPRGRTTWLALFDVIRIVEFDDLDQLRAAARNQEQ